MFPALILGNTVVLKPAHETPLIGAAWVELLDEAGFPPGVVNLIQGKSEDIGEYMVSHPGINMISYTGSTKVGRHIASVAGRNLVPVSLELNAKNAMIINSDARLELALDWAILSSFATNGQRETAASRIILLEDIADAFTEAFLDRVDKEVSIGDPLRDDPYMGPLISEEQVQAAEAYVQSCLDNGGRVLCGGKRPQAPELAGGYFFEPTVIEGVDPTSEPAREETLGPVTLLFRVKDLDEAVELANSTPYGLSMAVFTKDIDVGMSVVQGFDCGVAWINAGTCGAEVGLQFGGAKDTGIGTSEWGQAALDTFSRWKTTYINYSGEHRFVFEDTRF
jgi:acyl-CoA reductase-like NAD-dependent aldehyde dehydrogenase